MKKKAACEYQKYNNIKVDTVKQRRENQINGFKQNQTTNIKSWLV